MNYFEMVGMKMAVHEITSQYKELSETKGTLQNLSVHTIEISVDPDTPGLVVKSGEKLSFALEKNQKLYVRTLQDGTANIVIVNFKQPAGSGSGSAGTDGKDGREIELMADDEYIKWRYVGDEWQNLIAKSELGGGDSGGISNYKQITKLGVTATAAVPKIVEIQIKNTTTFCLPPVEVLKFAQGAQDVVSTVCEFDNADATDFVYDEKYMVFDGTMKLKTSFDVKINEPVALGDGFISESEEIDFAEYKSVERVI